MSKMTLLLAAGAGYVLGARAGRGRYEQIKQKTNDVWSHPRVQEGATQAQDLLQNNAPKVADKIADVATAATSKARAATHRDDVAHAAEAGTTGSRSHG